MIGVAIVGAGIGREHLTAYRELADRFEVRAMCDLDAGRAADAVEGTGITVETDLAAVLADPGVALVDVCLPPHLHAPVAIEAMEAGRDVVCEKPLAISPREADAMIAVAERTGRRLTPVFQYRFGPAMAKLEALREARLLGRPFVAAAETHWDRRADYYAIPWRGTWAGENGGAVLGHAIHMHDLLATLLGPVEAVTAMVATSVNAIEVEDCAAVTLRTASGALATSSITLGAANDSSRLRLCYEHLTAESDALPYRPMEGEWRFTARDAARQAEVDGVLAGVAPVRTGFQGFLEALADATEGRPGARAVTMEDGRRSIELVAAIYASARSGATVHLPLAPGDPLRGGWRPGPADGADAAA